MLPALGLIYTTVVPARWPHTLVPGVHTPQKIIHALHNIVHAPQTRSLALATSEARWTSVV